MNIMKDLFIHLHIPKTGGTTLRDIIQRQYQAEKILIKAEKKEEESNQIVEFTGEIKKYSMEFRLKIIEIIWKIVYSDGKTDNFESNLIRRICGLLYVTAVSYTHLTLPTKA